MSARTLPLPDWLADTTLRCALFQSYDGDITHARWQTTTAVLSRLDHSIGCLFDMDKTYQLIERLAPQGEWQSRRKTWSYYGGIRKRRDVPLCMSDSNPNAVRDPGNYCYAVIMRIFASMFPASHWRYHTYCNEYNNETLGDILEAILGAAWMCRHEHMTWSLEDSKILNEYTLIIEQCVEDTEQVILLTQNMGIRTDSQSLARLLL